MFYELRMELYDSHVDNKHIGFFKSLDKLNDAEKEHNPTGDHPNGSFYTVEHTFEDEERG